MRAPTSLCLVLAVVALGLVSADSALAADDNQPTAPVTLRICRLPGIGTGVAQPVTIPSGTRFDDRETADTPPLAQNDPPRLPAAVATMKTVSLSADSFCLNVQAKPVPGTTTKALTSAQGQMLAVGGTGGLALLGEVYGYLQPETPDGPIATQP